MSEATGIWQRQGRDVEDLDDPFTPLPPPPADAVPPARKRRGWLKIAFYSTFVFMVLILAWLVITAPLGRALEPLKDPAMLLLTQEGTPIARRGAIKEAPVEIARLDPLTPAAFIAIEDRRFRSHWGIDPRAIGRAMAANFSAGGVRQGGSTLTQQLAKTSFLSSDRSYKRKAQEVIIAFWLEAWLTKDDILQRYLSSVYFGDGVYGLRAASNHYFDRSPERLSLAQSAMLAGMVQAPSRLAPTRNLAGAQKRSRLVLQEMADTGVITLSRARATRSARPVIQPRKIPTGTYFADWVAPQARAAFDANYGEVRVSTTLDADLQKLAVRAISNSGLPRAQAALVAMRPDGRVVAMVGGKSYKQSPFNRATQARRQPGSAFKLFVYLAALRAGYSPGDMIDDKPITIDGWTPRNSDGVYRGSITLREAFARSSNAAAVRLSERVGRDNVIRAARDLGIRSPLSDSPSLALGSSSVSLIELTAAYAAIAGGRYPVRPQGLPLMREGRDGGMASWLAAGGSLDRGREWAPMLDLLWAAANEGTGRRAALNVPTYGKTGTTQDHQDAIFVGFAGDLVIGVWVGRDDNRSLGNVSGGTAPAAIWRAFASPAMTIDRRPSVMLPHRPPQPRLPEPRQSPIPRDWTEQAPALEEMIEAARQLIDSLGQ
ncbi:MAG: transglycosylase domain-containing protein [Pseudomonadota bacterium]|nr:transglycosylase domain-containing protein [Pseudomonadota bacterium]